MEPAEPAASWAPSHDAAKTSAHSSPDVATSDAQHFAVDDEGADDRVWSWDEELSQQQQQQQQQQSVGGGLEQVLEEITEDIEEDVLDREPGAFASTQQGAGWGQPQQEGELEQPQQEAEEHVSHGWSHAPVESEQCDAQCDAQCGDDSDVSMLNASTLGRSTGFDESLGLSAPNASARGFLVSPDKFNDENAGPSGYLVSPGKGPARKQPRRVQQPLAQQQRSHQPHQHQPQPQQAPAQWSGFGSKGRAILSNLSVNSPQQFAGSMQQLPRVFSNPSMTSTHAVGAQASESLQPGAWYA